MLKVGKYNILTVARQVDFGFYLADGVDDVLLPKRYAPKGLKTDDEIKVFVYHDNEKRLIATTEEPYGIVDEIAFMEVSSVMKAGAFLKWGIMKDLFVPIALQDTKMREGMSYFVKIFIDEETGRITGNGKIDKFLTNSHLTVSEGDAVKLLVYKKTDIGYKVIINSLHLGVLHYNEVFKELEIGDQLLGHVKKIREENKIDVSPGVKGYLKVADEETKITEMLDDADGYLPYNDNSAPEDIYEHFGMSKKVFKMTLGALYKKKIIEFTQTGIKRISQSE
jgi:uncharacterized protein